MLKKAAGTQHRVRNPNERCEVRLYPVRTDSLPGIKAKALSDSPNLEEAMKRGDHVESRTTRRDYGRKPDEEFHCREFRQRNCDQCYRQITTNFQTQKLAKSLGRYVATSLRRQLGEFMVGARGFEPPTTCTPCKYATRLRYAPKRELYQSRPASRLSPFPPVRHPARLTACPQSPRYDRRQ